jgi:hypothetical protein
VDVSNLEGLQWQIAVSLLVLFVEPIADKSFKNEIWSSYNLVPLQHLHQVAWEAEFCFPSCSKCVDENRKFDKIIIKGELTMLSFIAFASTAFFVLDAFFSIRLTDTSFSRTKNLKNNSKILAISLAMDINEDCPQDFKIEKLICSQKFEQINCF